MPATTYPREIESSSSGAPVPEHVLGTRSDPAERRLLLQIAAHVESAPPPASTVRAGNAIAHAWGVAGILADLGLDTDSIAAGMLGALAPLNAAATIDVRDRFGAAIAELADGAARMDAIGTLRAGAAATSPAGDGAQLERLRKMLLAMVQDVRVVLIKLADHLQELRERVKDPDRARAQACAVLGRDLFAPLANRLGVWQIKWEMEDLVFRVLEPDVYRDMARMLDEKRVDRERFIEDVVRTLRAALTRAGVTAEVTGRPKHLYSIYRKIQSKRLDFSQVYDVRAVRIIVSDVKDCYAALGAVHELWSPIPKEFDDYIAKPKDNHYRSLHTAVVGPDGRSVEVQIRTREMHQHSELGVAAHWRYKEGGRQEQRYDEKIAWLRQVLDWKDEVRNTGEFAEQFRVGLFDEMVYVLTPQGRVIDLPRGSTPVDFAYHVHTELGHRCRGARVDGALVPLHTPLENGQRVEILAAKQGGPSRDWLNPQLGYLRSASARTRVRQWFNRQNLDNAISQGRALIDRELQRQGATGLNLEALAAESGHDRLSDYLAAIGRADIGSGELRDAIRSRLSPTAAVQPEASMPVRGPAHRDGGGVLIVGVDRLMTNTARCCKPVPPEAIVGFVTRGRGVSVHRANCANVGRLDSDRLVAAEWGAPAGLTFPVDVVIEAVDRTGLLRDISEILTRERINVTATSTASGDLAARMRFTVEVADLTQLQRALSLVREVKGVVRAARR